MSQTWTSTEILQAIFAFAGVLAITPLIRLVFNLVTVQVEDETAVLITRFGRLVETLKNPGAHLFWSKSLPWVRTIPISLQRDYRHYPDIHVNDRSGTTVIVDLWIEFRITNPERALFQIENWELALQSLLTHSASSILGTQDFAPILENRSQLGSMLKKDILEETNRWGLEIEEVFIRQVSLLPEISRQMFASVAARLERAKADVEEEGRLKVAELEAQTAARIAELVAEAKGQHLLAVGQAYDELSDNFEVLQAYKKLYELSLVRPHRTVAFQGFAAGEIREIDALMTFPAGNQEVPS